MSTADADDEPTPGRNEIWIEKYRPTSLDDILGQEEITDRLKSYIERDELPNLMFSGEAGIGKCVTGDTPVLTNRGVERIESVVGDVEGFQSPDAGLEVLTFTDDGEFEYTEPTDVFGKRARETVTVETRDGGDMTVTPEHQLLVIGEDGLDWQRADQLEDGDRIARPLRATLPEGDGDLDWLSEMDSDRTFVHVTEAFAAEHSIPSEEDYVGDKKRVLRGVRNGRVNAEIAENTGVKPSTVQSYRHQLSEGDYDRPTTVCSLSYLQGLDASRDTLREHVDAVQYVTPQNKRSPPITPKWKVTPELASFLGLAISEARLDNGRIKFYNTDDRLLNRFDSLTRELFDLEPKTGEQNGVPYVEINSKSLTHFLESCFDVFDSATGGSGIGTTIVRADEKSQRAFLRAVFDAEGHVTDGGILELTQKNEDHITLLSYLLAGTGIPSRRDTNRKAATNGADTERTYHTLYVSGSENLARFGDAVGFTISRKSERLAENAAREPNPNHDTIPAQKSTGELCEALYLKKSDLLTKTLNPENPGRENHLADVDAVVDAAVTKLETAQTVRTEVAELSDELASVSKLPATWIDNRELLQPIARRKELADETGIRGDYLLEYADGRRTPGANRTGSLLSETDSIHQPPSVETVQQTLTEAIERLGVPYAHIAEETHLRGADVINLLRNDDHDLESLTRFETVAERVVEIASSFLRIDVIEQIHALDRVADADLYYDEVTAVERTSEERRVFDLTVPGSRNYVAGAVPTVMHNTTAATNIAREVYGDDWEENFLELNASDQRGIDVVRGRIKDFARASFGEYDYRIIFLDEADSLTSDAQSALRRTMEQFSGNTRFILSCNYSSQIIDPIQSRCAVFRFSPLSDEAVEEQVRQIAEIEGIELTQEGIDAIAYAADGDMRKAINALQAAAVMGETVDEDAVFTITSTARPEEVKEMVTQALDGDFVAARSALDELLTEKGIAGGDVIDQLHRSVWEFDLGDEAAVRLMDRVGEADYRITEGANERVQLEALLASLALED